MPEARPQAGPFAWTEFYQEVAEKLLDYRGDRAPLLEQLRLVASELPVVK